MSMCCNINLHTVTCCQSGHNYCKVPLVRWNYPSRDLQRLVALSVNDSKYKVERKRVVFKVSGKINIFNTKDTSSSYLSVGV